MNNQLNITLQNSKPFILRFLQYQKERFHLISHGILITVFTFSAISYSIFCSGGSAFIDLPTFFLTASITISLFFLLRLMDEQKDYEDDVKHRTYLPVPRGLISLKEIDKMVAAVIVGQIVLLSILKPALLPVYVICLVYMLLMRVEFFIPEWLKKNQIPYILSHMLIIPLVDTFASSSDWLLSGNMPPKGLMLFFIVSFLNGLVLEFGRKMRTKETEEEGVISYTKMWGIKKAVFIWIAVLFSTLFTAGIACYYAHHPMLVYVLLIVVFIICALPAMFFLKRPTKALSKYIEHASGLWTICMYLILGAGPMIVNLF